MTNKFRYPYAHKRRLRTTPTGANWVALLNYWEETHPYPGFEMPEGYPSTVPFPNQKVADIITDSMHALGYPYTWGGKTFPYFDCSGFVGWYYKKHGVMPQDIASYTGAFWYWLRPPIESHPAGEPPTSAALPGDIILYNGRQTGTPDESYAHVAIYLGDNYIIDSSGGGVQFRRTTTHSLSYGVYRVPGLMDPDPLPEVINVTTHI